MAPTLSELEEAYFQPIIKATASPGDTQLLEVQCQVIEMWRSVFSICWTEEAARHALALSLTVPHLRNVWEKAQALGLRTPLETQAS